MLSSIPGGNYKKSELNGGPHLLPYDQKRYGHDPPLAKMI